MRKEEMVQNVLKRLGLRRERKRKIPEESRRRQSQRELGKKTLERVRMRKEEMVQNVLKRLGLGGCLEEKEDTRSVQEEAKSTGIREKDLGKGAHEERGNGAKRLEKVRLEEREEKEDTRRVQEEAKSTGISEKSLGKGTHEGRGNSAKRLEKVRLEEREEKEDTRRVQEEAKSTGISEKSLGKDCLESGHVFALLTRQNLAVATALPTIVCPTLL
ncbi:inner centromere protein-like [Macrobrachium rosenbergii]|uniref:inner centromere protein-like n=1 Tax=Macrobrachium rosenbergii TaxID=79674 RepID=UPI0034D6D862